MNDLIDRLARLDGTASTPSESVVSGDLARAHSALGRRRRTRAAMAGTGLTLGLGAALGVVVAVNAGDDTAPPVSGPSTSEPGRQQGAGIELVDYNGSQVAGFELAKVPAGYEIQGSDAFVLTLAEPGDKSHYLSFVDKVVVTLESQDAAGGLPEGEEVSVNGEPGVLYTAPDGLADYLAYLQGDHHVVIQAWKTVGLSGEQLIAFAESITVTGDVRAPVG